jgi:hypothetical protein
MKRWNDLITKMSVGMEKYIMDTINSWRKSKIEKDKVFNALKHERDQVNYGIEMIEYLKGKIKT